MSSASKTFLLILGLLTAVFILAQIVMGQLILGGRSDLIKAHQHSGYTTVVLTLLYVGASLRAIMSVPTREKPSTGV